MARTLSLEVETPVECVVYQRAYGKGNAFESPETIYIVRGVIPAGGKRVDISEVNSASADRLLVPRRKSYDILFLVNDSPCSDLYDEDGALKDGIFGSLNFNVISGLGHGCDVMAGEKTTYVDDGIFKAMVRFKSLRHLGTSIAVEVRTGDGKPAVVQNQDGEDSGVPVSVESLEFTGCLPSGADIVIPKSGRTLEYQVHEGMYDSSFVLRPEDCSPGVLNPVSDTFLTDAGYILPCPLDMEGRKNSFDITFNLKVDYRDVQLHASQLKLPPLRGGEKYTFRLDFKDGLSADGQVDLYLNIWSSYVYLGSWDALEWAAWQG